MKLKEHKIAITLGVIGLLIPLTYFIDKDFFIIMLIIVFPALSVILYCTTFLISLFYVQIQEISVLTLAQLSIIFCLYHTTIGYFIDRAIKNKEKRKIILSSLIFIIIFLNIIGYILIDKLKMLAF